MLSCRLLIYLSSAFMSRYQPPHLRISSNIAAKGASSSSSGPQVSDRLSSGMQSRWAPSTRAGPSSTRSPLVQRDGSASSQQPPRRPETSSAQVLASPASDIRPRQATREWSKPSGMEMLASVSRSGGDGQEGDALKDHATQHAFRRYIEQRLDQHHSRFQSSRAAPPSVESKEELESMKSIVLLFRKLREGVTAAHRIDGFAIEVYESSALLAILAHDTSQLVSTLSVLVPGLYRAHDEIKSNSLENAVGNLSVTGDRRVLFVSLFLLYYLCHLDSQSAFWTHHRELTAGERAFVKAETLENIASAAEALSPRFPNPRLFFATLKNPSMDAHERVMLTWARERMRERACAVLRKAYLDAGKDWIFATLDLSEEDGHEWIKKEGFRIEGDKVKLRQ